jgi:hypothetical protein
MIDEQRYVASQQEFTPRLAVSAGSSIPLFVVGISLTPLRIHTSIRS